MSLKSIFLAKAQSIDQSCYWLIYCFVCLCQSIALTNLIGQCGFQCRNCNCSRLNYRQYYFAVIVNDVMMIHTQNTFSFHLNQLDDFCLTD